MDVSSNNTLWFLLSCLVAPQVAKRERQQNNKLWGSAE